MWKTKFSFHKQYLFGLLIQTKVYCKLFYCLKKKTSHKPLKVATAKRSFSSVYIIHTTCFDECFLFHVIIGRHYFLYKFIVTKRFGTIAILLHSLRQVFWKKSAFYICYLHNNITMLLILKVQNKASTSLMLLTKFIWS